jgi:acetyl-CoA C-acetyltransferase
VDLSAVILEALVARSGVDANLIEDVFWGCVGQAGEQGVNIARNAVLASKLPDCIPGTTIDRQCGSSQQALHFAAHTVSSRAMDMVVAGGVESMSRVPMGLPSTLAAKAGYGTYLSSAVKKR